MGQPDTINYCSEPEIIGPDSGTFVNYSDLQFWIIIDDKNQTNMKNIQLSGALPVTGILMVTYGYNYGKKLAD